MWMGGFPAANGFAGRSSWHTVLVSIDVHMINHVTRCSVEVEAVRETTHVEKSTLF